MGRHRRTVVAAVTAAMLAALLATAAPAHAEDVLPGAPVDAVPTETAPSPDPSVEPTPDPTEPTTPPAPAPAPAPAKPVAKPASKLPLREGAIGWRVQHVQERLLWLGYDIFEGNLDNERMGESTVAAVKRFQGKFGYRPTGVVGPGTYDLLDTLAGKVGKLPASCLGERTICVDKTTRLVRLVEKDKVVLTLDARFGFTGAETHEGTFRVHMKSRDHVSSLYRTWMPFALFFSGGQAVHYSPYFARDGYNGGSHGCVNLRDFDSARWLFDHVPLGTRVYVYRS